MVKRAEVTLELELGKEIDYANCTDAEEEFITVLAAIYAIIEGNCYLCSLTYANHNTLGNVLLKLLFSDN